MVQQFRGSFDSFAKEHELLELYVLHSFFSSITTQPVAFPRLLSQLCSDALVLFLVLVPLLFASSSLFSAPPLLLLICPLLLFSLCCHHKPRCRSSPALRSAPLLRRQRDVRRSLSELNNIRTNPIILHVCYAMSGTGKGSCVRAYVHCALLLQMRYCLDSWAQCAMLLDARYRDEALCT